MQKFLEMIAPILAQVLGTIMTPENIKVYGDRLFDLIEDVVRDSSTPIDDVLVLPIIRAMRAGLNIPDRGDEAAEA